ncbi:MAG: hypothetical protein AABX84_02415 [Nanoarchaeota archaeon]
MGNFHVSFTNDVATAFFTGVCISDERTKSRLLSHDTHRFGLFRQNDKTRSSVK